MRPSIVLFPATVVLITSLVSAQDQPLLTPRVSVAPKDAGAAASTHTLTVPAGTKVPLTLKQGITTKTAKEGDPVYAQTAFPVAQNDMIVIPAGTFVQGVVRRVQRPGRVKGRAELQVNFTSMIFPNGYTLLLPGSVEGAPGSEDMNTKGKEGTIEGRGTKGKDAGTIAQTTGAGAGIGALAGGGKGAAIGSLSGGTLGLATVLLTRGPELTLGPGSSLEMVLERTITIDEAKLRRSALP